MILYRDENEDVNVEANVEADETAVSEENVALADTEEKVTSDLAAEVNSLLDELNEIEKSLGMNASLDDIDFPEFKPIILPEVKIPTPQVPVITKADVAKMDDEQLKKIMEKLAKVEVMEAELKAMKEFLEERLSLDFRAMYDNIMEKTNIEAIKIYRNVQAVVIEENAKQNQAIFALDSKANSLKKRMNNVLIFAIVSFVVSILVMLVTILPAFGIKLF